MLCLWPYTTVTGKTMEWRVPVDDTHTLNITRQYSVYPDDAPPICRTKEPLGRTDAGVTRLRDRFLEETSRVADGTDPTGTIRDPAQNDNIQLPVYCEFWYVDGMPRQPYDQMLEWHRRSLVAAGIIR